MTHEFRRGDHVIAREGHPRELIVVQTIHEGSDRVMLEDPLEGTPSFMAIADQYALASANPRPEVYDWPLVTVAAGERVGAAVVRGRLHGRFRIADAHACIPVTMESGAVVAERLARAAKMDGLIDWRTPPGSPEPEPRPVDGLLGLVATLRGQVDSLLAQTWDALTDEVRQATLAEHPKATTPLAVGDRVVKRKGYHFPGVVRAVFENGAGETRYVVESEIAPGLLHIYSAANIEARQ